jgi:hypothetical protein
MSVSVSVSYKRRRASIRFIHLNNMDTYFPVRALSTSSTARHKSKNIASPAVSNSRLHRTKCCSLFYMTTYCMLFSQGYDKYTQPGTVDISYRRRVTRCCYTVVSQHTYSTVQGLLKEQYM